MSPAISVKNVAWDFGLSAETPVAYSESFVRAFALCF